MDAKAIGYALLVVAAVLGLLMLLARDSRGPR